MGHERKVIARCSDNFLLSLIISTLSGAQAAQVAVALHHHICVCGGLRSSVRNVKRSNEVSTWYHCFAFIVNHTYHIALATQQCDGCSRTKLRIPAVCRDVRACPQCGHASLVPCACAAWIQKMCRYQVPITSCDLASFGNRVYSL